MKGWILDVSADHSRDLIDTWIVSEDGERLRLSEPFKPSIYVGGDPDRLSALAEHLSTLEGVSWVRSEEAYLDVHHTAPSECLRVEIGPFSAITPIAREIERIGEYRSFSLYDVDTRLSTRYMMLRGIHPLAHVEVGSRFKVLDDPDWGKEPLPPLRALPMHVFPDKRGPVPLLRDPIREVRLGEWSDSGRSEGELIISLVREIAQRDPDILVSAGGDSFVLPYLYHRSLMSGVESELVLDRSGELFRAPVRQGKSYFSYGNIMFKPFAYTMKGRLHLDAENSFVSHEGGLIGLATLSRMSLLTLQDMARLSPGSAISYMECVEALRRGRHVRWKKNLPEAWKSAVELSVSDRGGHIFDPVVGAFSEVVEMDFSSFYPHIMWRKNLSVETLNCPCCAPSPENTVPALGYHVCARQEGLISAVVGRILTERMRAKDLSKGARTCELRFPEESGMGDLVPRNGRDRYRSISTILKMVLVTCFGYTGYRNARNGKIEAHECGGHGVQAPPRHSRLHVGPGAAGQGAGRRRGRKGRHRHTHRRRDRLQVDRVPAQQDERRRRPDEVLRAEGRRGGQDEGDRDPAAFHPSLHKGRPGGGHRRPVGGQGRLGAALDDGGGVKGAREAGRGARG